MNLIARANRLATAICNHLFRLLPPQQHPSDKSSVFLKVREGEGTMGVTSKMDVVEPRADQEQVLPSLACARTPFFRSSFKHAGEGCNGTMLRIHSVIAATDTHGFHSRVHGPGRAARGCNDCLLNLRRLRTVDVGMHLLQGLWQCSIACNW